MGGCGGGAKGVQAICSVSEVDSRVTGRSGGGRNVGGGEAKGVQAICCLSRQQSNGQYGGEGEGLKEYRLRALSQKQTEEE